MPAADERLTHHDLCFGCGQANLFGLQLELERLPEGGVTGRFFVKQDQQGPPGYAHGGVVAAALDEAMSLLLHSEGIAAVTRSLEMDYKGPAPVGAFVRVEATIQRRREGSASLRATARTEGEEPVLVAEARAVFVER